MREVPEADALLVPRPAGRHVEEVAQAATPARAAAPVAHQSEIGGSAFPFPGLLVLLAIIAGASFVVADDENSDSP